MLLCNILQFAPFNSSVSVSYSLGKLVFNTKFDKSKFLRGKLTWVSNLDLKYLFFDLNLFRLRISTCGALYIIILLYACTKSSHFLQNQALSSPSYSGSCDNYKQSSRLMVFTT
jgi:hypothetical protein